MNKEFFTKTHEDMDEASLLIHSTHPFYVPELFMEEWNESEWATALLSNDYMIICAESVSYSSCDESASLTKTFFPMLKKPFNAKKFAKEFGLAFYKAECAKLGYRAVDAFHLSYIVDGVVTCISYILNCDHPAIYELDMFEVKMDGLLITEIAELENEGFVLFKPSLLKTFQAARETFANQID